MEFRRPAYDLGGLTNGVSYDVLVRAVNAVGHGPWSPAATGTPRTTPGAPVIDSLIPGGGALNVGPTYGFAVNLSTKPPSFCLLRGRAGPTVRTGRDGTLRRRVGPLSDPSCNPSWDPPLPRRW